MAASIPLCLAVCKGFSFISHKIMCYYFLYALEVCFERAHIDREAMPAHGISLYGICFRLIR